ncbi:DUF924 domain-containing protein [Bacteriovoracaceae bacterium]|nr:DUF924 domain-containing protein [Bacteriovoracaceae bacterium]
MEAVLNFWFKELTPKDWWKKSDELDALIKQRFEEIHQQAIHGELYLWRNTPEGRLAEIIVLDQFSRNIYRNDPRSFMYDSLALILAQECTASGDDQKLEESKRSFVYMPFMHSESLVIHDYAVDLYTKLGSAESLKFETSHRDIIVKFGRYPHRNEILGRDSTAEEIEFLQNPGSSF